MMADKTRLTVLFQLKQVLKNTCKHVSRTLATCIHGRFPVGAADQGSSAQVPHGGCSEDGLYNREVKFTCD